MKGKDKRLCFAKGQTIQPSMHTPKKECKTLGNMLLNEGWPNLKCQIVDISRVKALAEKTLVCLDEVIHSWREGSSLADAEEGCYSK